MTQMIRKQMYLEPGQDALVKRLSRLLGLTEAEVIRRAIDQQLSVSVPGVRDPAAWEREKAFIAQRIATGSVAGHRQWRREDAYEERLARYGK